MLKKKSKEKRPELSKNELKLNDYIENININERLGSDKVTDEDIAKINKLAVKPINKSEIAVYSALLIDDQVTRNSTQYPREFQKTLLSLPPGEGNWIGAPFLFGDEKDHQDTASSQIGRVFDAWQVTDEKGHYGVMGKIGIPITNTNEETIKKIDSGILKEISISTKVELPICSLCKQDIRVCGHEKGVDDCHVIMTGKGFCGEVSLVAIPGSTKAKILNKDSLKLYARTESVKGLQKEMKLLRKDITELMELKGLKGYKEFALPVIAKGFMSVAKLMKVKGLLARVMKTGIGRLLGQPTKQAMAIKGISGQVSKLAGKTSLILAGVAGSVGLSGAALLKKTGRRIESIQINKGFKFSDDEDLKTAKFDFDEKEISFLKELNVLPEDISVENMDSMSEDQLNDVNEQIKEWLEQFDELKVQLSNHDENDVIVLDERNKEGFFPVIKQDENSSDEMHQNIRMVGTLNSINDKIEKANEKVIKYASKYVIQIGSISGDPTPKIEQGMKSEDVFFLTDNFYNKVEMLDRNLRSIESLVRFNEEAPFNIYKGTMTQIPELTLYINKTIDNILERVYQLEGRFNLEESEKNFVVEETVRLGTIANVVKFENKESVKKLFNNMTLDEVIKVKDAFFEKGTDLLKNIEHNDDKFKEPEKEKKETKDARPVNVMDFKKKVKGERK